MKIDIKTTATKTTLVDEQGGDSLYKQGVARLRAERDKANAEHAAFLLTDPTSLRIAEWEASGKVEKAKREELKVEVAKTKADAKAKAKAIKEKKISDVIRTEDAYYTEVAARKVEVPQLVVNVPPTTVEVHIKPFPLELALTPESLATLNGNGRGKVSANKKRVRKLAVELADIEAEVDNMVVLVDGIEYLGITIGTVDYGILAKAAKLYYSTEPNHPGSGERATEEDLSDYAESVQDDIGNAVIVIPSGKQEGERILQAFTNYVTWALGGVVVSRGKLPTQPVMARLVAKQRMQNTNYCAADNRWYRYSDGYWSVVDAKIIKGTVEAFIYNLGYRDHTDSYVNAVLTMTSELDGVQVANWIECDSTRYMPFNNGALEMSTKLLFDHSPDYRFLWQLPRNWEPEIKSWDNIDRFLTQLSNNDPELKSIAIAFCNAVLTSRSDLQKFLYLYGEGANGKGQYMKLLSMLIGARNCHSSDMGTLNTDKYEADNLVGKRLLTMADESAYHGSIANLKKITGGDPIRTERKYGAASSYTYQGMVVMAANNPTFAGNSDNALQRRKIDFPCLNVVPVADRRDLEADFTDNLSAFTTYLLSLETQWVTDTLRNAGQVAAVKLLNHELSIRENSIAAFIAEHVEVELGAVVGSQKVYNDYGQYCDNSGLKAKALNNFSADLILEMKRLGATVEKRRERLAGSTNAVGVLTNIKLINPTTMVSR